MFQVPSRTADIVIEPDPNDQGESVQRHVYKGGNASKVLSDIDTFNVILPSTSPCN